MPFGATTTVPFHRSAPASTHPPCLTVSGLLSSHTTSVYQCIIVAAGWPAWVFLCGTLHLHCLAVFTSSWDHPWTSTAQTRCPIPPACWHPLSQLVVMASTLITSLPCCTFLVHSPSISIVPPERLSSQRFLWSGLQVTSPLLPFPCRISHLESGRYWTRPFHFTPTQTFKGRFPPFRPLLCSR
jgi:hypothetical protein